MHRIKLFFLWFGGVVIALSIFIGSMLTLLIVFDEMSYWRTLLRQGEYQKLDAIFSDLEKDTFNPLRGLAWVFSREIHNRFPNFSIIKDSFSISILEKRAATCMSANQEYITHFMLLPDKETKVLKSILDKNLCEIEYQVRNGPFGLNVMLAIREIKSQDLSRANFIRGDYGYLKPGNSKSLTLKFISEISVPRSYQLLLIAGKRLKLGSLNWLDPVDNNPDLPGLIRRAERLGLIFISTRYEVIK